MRLNTLIRNHRISIRLMNSQRTLVNFGIFPEDMTLKELIDSGLLRKIVNATKREAHKELYEKLERMDT